MLLPLELLELHSCYTIWNRKANIKKITTGKICVCVWGGLFVNISLKNIKFNKTMGNEN